MSQPGSRYRKLASLPNEDDVHNSIRGNEQSKTRWLPSHILSTVRLNLQASFIYALDGNYVAGKIVRVDGSDFKNDMSPTHIRVHVVVLPVKKYVKKTEWYKVGNRGQVIIGDYFKYTFPLRVDSMTIFRIRVYGRALRLGSLGRSFCMGECYVTTMEMSKARGGLTVYRALSAGVT